MPVIHSDSVTTVETGAAPTVLLSDAARAGSALAKAGCLVAALVVGVVLTALPFDFLSWSALLQMAVLVGGIALFLRVYRAGARCVIEFNYDKAEIHYWPQLGRKTEPGLVHSFSAVRAIELRVDVSKDDAFFLEVTFESAEPIRSGAGARQEFAGWDEIMPRLRRVTDGPARQGAG